MNTSKKTKEVVAALQDLDFTMIPTKEVVKCRRELKEYMEELRDEIAKAKKQKDSILLAKLEEANHEIMALDKKMDIKSVRDYERVSKVIMGFVILVVVAVMVLIGLVGSTILDGGSLGNLPIIPSQGADDSIDEFSYLYVSVEDVVNEFGDGYEVVSHEGGLFMTYDEESIPYDFGFVSLEPNSQVVTIILHQGAEYMGIRIGMALPVVIEKLGQPNSATVNEIDGGYSTKYVRDEYTIEFFSADEKSIVDAAVIRKLKTQ